MGLYLGHPGDDIPVSQYHACAPAAGIIGLGKGIEFHPDLPGPIELEEAGRLVPIKADLGVRVI